MDDYQWNSKSGDGAPASDTAQMPHVSQAPPQSPPPSSAPPGSAAPGAPGLAWWWVLVAAAAAAIIAGLGVYLLVGGGTGATAASLQELKASNAALEQQVADLNAKVTSAEASLAAATATLGSSSPGGSEEPATPATEKQFTYIKKVTWSAAKGYELTADYAQLLTGKAAADAATAHGDESPPPNDYYILNDNPKLRTFPLAKTASVIVLGWGGTDATARKTIPVGQFMDVMPGGVNPQDQWVRAPYYITITGGTITKVEQYYIP